MRDTFAVVSMRLGELESRVRALEETPSLSKLLPAKVPWPLLLVMGLALKAGILGAISPETLEKLLLFLLGAR